MPLIRLRSIQDSAGSRVHSVPRALLSLPSPPISVPAVTLPRDPRHAHRVLFMLCSGRSSDRFFVLVFVAPGFPPIRGGPGDLCREARHLGFCLYSPGILPVFSILPLRSPEVVGCDSSSSSFCLLDSSFLFTCPQRGGRS